jgi:SAM-dependent methyltransferase
MEKHEQITIAEYQIIAEDYRIGTWHHDVSQNRDALIAAMNKSMGRILDLGCGPGRDLVVFQKMGYQVTGLEATPAFVEMSKQIAGCEVWHQSFLSLELPIAVFK